MTVFPLLLSCFYFCKCLPSIYDEEINPRTVRARSSLRKISRHDSRHGDVILGRKEAEVICTYAVQQWNVTEITGTTSNASHATDRIYTTMLYYPASWLNQ